MKHTAKAAVARVVLNSRPWAISFVMWSFWPLVWRLAVYLAMPWFIPGFTNRRSSVGMIVEIVYRPYCSDPRILAIMKTDRAWMIVDVMFPRVR